MRDEEGPIAALIRGLSPTKSKDYSGQDIQAIPRIQAIFDGLKGQEWFSSLDVAMAYHQGYFREEEGNHSFHSLGPLRVDLNPYGHMTIFKERGLIFFQNI